MKKFTILIEDDFEIMGNGLGNVADLQYLPALSLMNMAEEMGIKLSFMVDVAHRLTLEKFQKTYRNLRVQKLIWDETVLMMKERGFDVQLHLHPQWLNADFKDGYFHLSGNWNIGGYRAAEQKQLLMDSINFLRSLLKPVSDDYEIIAFKAGSWGLQPSEKLLAGLTDFGIKIVLGVRDGLKIPAASIDYTNLEEKELAYSPDMQDITRVASRRNGLTVIPLLSYEPGIATLLKLSFNVVKNKL